MSQMPAARRGDLARRVLQLLALGGLLLASVWVVRPFLPAAIWATMIAISTWPLLLRLQRLLLGRRALAVTALTLVLLLTLVIPLYLGVRAIVNSAGDIADLAQAVAKSSVPPPPDWLAGVPFVGAKAAAEWSAIAAEGPDELAARVTPYAQQAARWLVGEIGDIGALLLQFLLMVIFTAVLYAGGEGAAQTVERFARRLAGAQGVKAAQLAARATRAVALGVVVTALVQSALVGLGFAVVGVPFTPILTVICFVLAVAQIGPIPILIGAVIWAYTKLGGVWGTGLLVWGVFCGLIDNFVRPVLIKRGADLPLLLIFVGVVGGLIGFGVVGLFIGPVVLAVSYMLLADWLAEPE